MSANLLTRCHFAVAFLVFLVAAVDSNAGPITADNVPTITVDDEGFAGPPWEYSPALDVLQNLPGRGKKLGVAKAEAKIQGKRANVEISQLEFDPDPFVLNNILITNTTDSTAFYTVGIALPTSFAAPSLISGTVRTDVIDGDDVPGGAVASVPGFPIYTAQIDFNNVATLQDHPFSVTAPPAGTASLAASFGPMFNAVPVTSSIGIQLRFSLTAGDTASILSRFDVVGIPIPEPTTLCLAALSVLVMGRYRQRLRVAGAA
jgi:hypothetical protein